MDQEKVDATTELTLDRIRDLLSAYSPRTIKDDWAEELRGQCTQHPEDIVNYVNSVKLGFGSLLRNNADPIGDKAQMEGFKADATYNVEDIPLGSIVYDHHKASFQRITPEIVSEPGSTNRFVVLQEHLQAHYHRLFSNTNSELESNFSGLCQQLLDFTPPPNALLAYTVHTIGGFLVYNVRICGLPDLGHTRHVTGAMLAQIPANRLVPMCQFDDDEIVFTKLALDVPIHTQSKPKRRTPQLSYRKHWFAMWTHAPESWLARINELRTVCRWVQYSHLDNAIRVDFVLQTRCRPGPLILKYFSPGCVLTGVSSMDRGIVFTK